MERRTKTNKQIFTYLVLISQFGINMLVPIGLMLWLGMWLDKKLETSWISILCFFVGAIAGFQNIYKMAKEIIKDKK